MWVYLIKDGLIGYNLEIILTYYDLQVATTDFLEQLNGSQFLF